MYKTKEIACVDLLFGKASIGKNSVRNLIYISIIETYPAGVRLPHFPPGR